MSKHQDNIEHYKDQFELAEAVGNLKYDSLANLFFHLSEKFFKDANADSFRGRPKLAGLLNGLAMQCKAAQYDADYLLKNQIKWKELASLK